MSWLARVRRLTRNFIAHGFGGTGTAPPAPVIITGPCTSQLFGDVTATAATLDASVSGFLLTEPTFSAALGDVTIGGLLLDPAIEGNAIDAC